jgi:serine-type D-Ala-D-Ala carboxypeptidase (penicillin-binding protein 5/6)
LRRAALAVLLLTAAEAAAQAGDPFPGAGDAYFLAVNGKARWERRADVPLAPASLTKVMTALLAFESGRPPDEPVIVTAAATRETGSRLGLRRGERLHLGDLLAATIQHSANDACHAVAAHIAGDEAAFVKLMNVRASAMGLRATRFTNACGHDHPQHRSSARDLAAPSAAYAAETWRTIRVLDGDREFRIANKNELIGRYRGAIGIKSGSTPGAGKCIAAMAERDGVRVLLVLLNARERWWTAVDMLNRAFEHAD